MNVIVSNKYHSMLVQLEIDVIKSIEGEFSIEEIVSTFSNFFYSRMILDITAIKNYKDIRNLQKLSINLDMSRVILVLDDNEASSSPTYLSKLISMGIYNFTRNKEGILYLLNNPNTYKDVAQFHSLDNVIEKVETKYKDSITIGINQTIIGFKNVTSDSGSTSLIYMIKKELANNYKVIGIELDKNDFAYFNDSNLFSMPRSNLEGFLSAQKDVEIILIDLNDADDNSCDETVYLLEPSIIKMGELLKVDPTIFVRLKDKKIVLNKSPLNSKDVVDFEFETKTKVFFNIPPLNDREENKILITFLNKLGFNKQSNEEKKFFKL